MQRRQSSSHRVNWLRSSSWRLTTAVRRSRAIDCRSLQLPQELAPGDDRSVKIKSLEAAKIIVKLWKLNGSFSAVSKPIFASKYSLESSWRDLQDLHAFAPLRPQYFSKFSSRIFEIFSQFFKQHRQNCSMFVPIRAETSPIFVGISQIFQKFLPQSTYRKSEENPWIF